MLRHAAAAIALVVATGCTKDFPTGNGFGDAQSAPPLASTMDTVRGVVQAVTDTSGATDIILLTDAGTTVKLVGPVAAEAALTAGMEIWVAGHFTAPDELMVESYDVLLDANGCMVDGRFFTLTPCPLVTGVLRPGGTATYSRKQ